MFTSLRISLVVISGGLSWCCLCLPFHSDHTMLPSRVHWRLEVAFIMISEYLHFYNNISYFDVFLPLSSPEQTFQISESSSSINFLFPTKWICCLICNFPWQENIINIHEIRDWDCPNNHAHVRFNTFFFTFCMINLLWSPNIHHRINSQIVGHLT